MKRLGLSDEELISMATTSLKRSHFGPKGRQIRGIRVAKELELRLKELRSQIETMKAEDEKKWTER